MGAELLEIATAVAVEAAALARTAREAAIHDVGTKSSETDVVTAADIAVEKLVRERLAELRPGEPVLGEESGSSGAAGGGVCWVVDPIDGTVNYLYGLPWYAVSLAAQQDGVSVAAAVVEPDSGRRWTASRGGGAYLDGHRLTV
ncbi:MAG TPA: inositol monophosphatase family protein, partial [Actinophytocola sp.]|uniref:inositol monophosphatase family protein n=1 Tax=Actinophytocola sp. TaxID=1872138 RepID=UPI002F92C7E7